MKNIRVTAITIESMSIIGNIRAMQDIVYGKSDKYALLARYKLEALRELQEELIPKYNNAIKNKG